MNSEPSVKSAGVTAAALVLLAMMALLAGGAVRRESVTVDELRTWVRASRPEPVALTASKAPALASRSPPWWPFSPFSSLPGTALPF